MDSISMIEHFNPNPGPIGPEDDDPDDEGIVISIGGPTYPRGYEMGPHFGFTIKPIAPSIRLPTYGVRLNMEGSEAVIATVTAAYLNKASLVIWGENKKLTAFVKCVMIRASE